MNGVVFVTTSYPRTALDPAGHFVETEARLRAEAGERITVLAPGPGETTTRDFLRIEWLPGGDAFGSPGAMDRLREHPLRAFSVARFVAAARRRLAELGPREIVAHWIVPSAWPVAYRAAASLEVVAHGSDVRLLERLPGPLRRAIVSSLLRHGARFRFVSHELRERLVRATTRDLLARSRVEPSPIDVRGAPSRNEARDRLGIGPGERVAVIVGRLVGSKRPAEAVRLALAEGATRVVVVGAGPLGAKTGAVHAAVELRGAVPRDVALTWIAAADLLVTASRDEGASTVVREARALGVPVVAARSGDLRAWAAEDPGIRVVDA